MKPESVEELRKVACYRDNIEAWSKLYRLTLATNSISTEFIFNLDETPLHFHYHSSSKVIKDANSSQTPAVVKQPRLPNSTLTMTICMDGTALPSQFLWPAARTPPEFCSLTQAQVVLFSAKTGWQTKATLRKYVENVIIPRIEEKRRLLGKQTSKALLLLDGHTSRQQSALLAKCAAHNLILLTIPAHTSNKIQPLDCGVNSVLKKKLRVCMAEQVRPFVFSVIVMTVLFSVLFRQDHSIHNTIWKWHNCSPIWNRAKQGVRLPTKAVRGHVPSHPRSTHTFNDNQIISSSWAVFTPPSSTAARLSDFGEVAVITTATPSRFFTDLRSGAHGPVGHCIHRRKREMAILVETRSSTECQEGLLIIWAEKAGQKSNSCRSKSPGLCIFDLILGFFFSHSIISFRLSSFHSTLSRYISRLDSLEGFFSFISTSGSSFFVSSTITSSSCSITISHPIVEFAFDFFIVPPTHSSHLFFSLFAIIIISSFCISLSPQEITSLARFHVRLGRKHLLTQSIIC